MLYTEQEVIDFAEAEDVKFIRLAFCDLFGIQKNISIMPSELPRAFASGISFDASAIHGFRDEATSDLLLFPDPSTLSVLPWRPSHGRVVRLYCDIKYPDGRPFELDSRYILRNAVSEAKKHGISCRFGTEYEFYLFKTDDEGNPTKTPHDDAGYMDISPADKGENIRREVCLTLEEMGIHPESSHHEEGPGQHEIDFKYSDPITSAENAVTFKYVVKTIAALNGLYASFSPKPIENRSGNGLHINFSVTSSDGNDPSPAFMAGILDHITEITAFLNRLPESYERLGQLKAPKYISWSPENRSQLIRIPAAAGEYKRIELRSPDPSANPYLVFALLIYTGLDGVIKGSVPPAPINKNLFRIDRSETKDLEMLPDSLSEAIKAALKSELVYKYLPDRLIDVYLKA